MVGDEKLQMKEFQVVLSYPVEYLLTISGYNKDDVMERVQAGDFDENDLELVQGLNPQEQTDPVVGEIEEITD